MYGSFSMGQTALNNIEVKSFLFCEERIFPFYICFDLDHVVKRRDTNFFLLKQHFVCFHCKDKVVCSNKKTRSNFNSTMFFHWSVEMSTKWNLNYIPKKGCCRFSLEKETSCFVVSRNNCRLVEIIIDLKPTPKF